MPEQTTTTPALITGHVWRPQPHGGSVLPGVRSSGRPCAYMNCGRPGSAHGRSITLPAQS